MKRQPPLDRREKLIMATIAVACIAFEAVAVAWLILSRPAT